MWTLFTLTIWCELEWLNLSRTGYGFERKLQQDYCVGIAEPLTKIYTLTNSLLVLVYLIDVLYSGRGICRMLCHG